MSGHVRQRSPGTWEIRHQRGDKTITKTIKGTKAEAQRALRQLMVEHDKGVAASAPAKLPVADWLRRWLDIATAEVRPITAERYEAAVRLYLAPALGQIKLRDLCPADIQAAFSTWAVGGRHRGEGGLARSTLGLLRKTLHAALQRALELELIGRHPMEPLRAERQGPRGQGARSRRDGGVARSRHGHIPPGHFARRHLRASARRGRRLERRNVDFDAASITITESTVPLRRGTETGKTKSGRTRTIAMPALVVTELRQHRLVMAERLLALGVKLSPNHTVVAREDGQPVNPVVLTAWCRRTFGKLHGLRHTHASQLLDAGVNIKAVSARLGHASAALTLSTYAHLLPGADQDAAQRIDNLLSRSKPVANAP